MPTQKDDLYDRPSFFVSFICLKKTGGNSAARLLYRLIYVQNTACGIRESFGFGKTLGTVLRDPMGMGRHGQELLHLFSFYCEGELN